MFELEKTSLLVVDDDLRLLSLLERYLASNGFTVSTASNASEAEDVLSSKHIDFIILDVMMPGLSGIEFVKKIRSEIMRDTPVLLLTAKSDVVDRIDGLESGADDYLPKPFDPKELLLRIKNIMKRSVGGSNKVLIGSSIINIDRGVITKNGNEITLSSTECILLKTLMSKPGSVFSREDLINILDGTVNERTIDVQITRLRKKIENDPHQPLYLKTIRHRGYVLWLS